LAKSGDTFFAASRTNYPEFGQVEWKTLRVERVIHFYNQLSQSSPHGYQQVMLLKHRLANVHGHFVFQFSFSAL
jgi:hypothetical protein